MVRRSAGAAVATPPLAPTPVTWPACTPQEVSSRIDAAFSPTGYAIVSDNEHI